MRVNVYAEEMTDRVEIVSKTIDGQIFTGLRFYLELPTTVDEDPDGNPVNVQGPFMHRKGDDDSSAVTFWGKSDLRAMLGIAQTKLDIHYRDRPATLPLQAQARRDEEYSGMPPIARPIDEYGR